MLPFLLTITKRRGKIKVVRKHSFFIRLCYGYVGGKLGKDTSKMTTEQVVQEFLKRNGVKTPREFFKKRFAKKHKLYNQQLPKSVGARWKNVPVLLPDGSYAKLKENSTIHNISVIAGKGRRRKIDDISRLLRENKGTKEQEWKKMKGYAVIVYDDGDEEIEELHWYYEPTVGMIEAKVK